MNKTCSLPVRFVHACLPVTEQVWHPMHLSRFITMAICAMTRMLCRLPAIHSVGRLGDDTSCDPVDCGWLPSRSPEVPFGRGQSAQMINTSPPGCGGGLP